MAIHPRKPIWTEGLFMTPQHLQQCDTYHESLLHARVGLWFPLFTVRMCVLVFELLCSTVLAPHL